MSAQASGIRILVVDGDKAFSDALAGRLKGLKKIPAAIEQAHTGQGMLDKVHRHAYDLIFLDAGMPGMDGLEILARVGQTTLPLPIVMTTSSQNVRVAVEAMKRGVLDYLMKDDLLSADLEGLI